MRTLTLENTNTKDVGLVLLASMIISLSGSISIPLWFTPVPLATQNIVVLLMAAMLGSKRGFLATLAFLTQGALGLPVFSAGAAGIMTMVGPRGGYFLGYLIASFVVGFIVERKKSLTVAFFLGNLVIYLSGASVLSAFVGVEKAFLLGVAPFLFGDLLKTILAIKLFRFSKKSESN